MELFIDLFTTKAITTSNNLNSFHHVNKISFERNDWNYPIYNQKSKSVLSVSYYSRYRYLK